MLLYSFISILCVFVIPCCATSNLQSNPYQKKNLQVLFAQVLYTQSLNVKMFE